MSTAAPFQKLYTDLQAELNQKGCNTSCCGIEAFHNVEKLSKLFRTVVKLYGAELAACLENPQDSTTAEIVGTLELHNDIELLMRELTDIEGASNERIRSVIAKNSLVLQEKLARLRHQRKGK